MCAGKGSTIQRHLEPMDQNADENASEIAGLRPPSESEGVTDAETDRLASTVLSISPEATIAVDETGRIRYANAATEALLGYDPESLVGRPGTTLVPSRGGTGRPSGLRSYLSPGRGANESALGTDRDAFGAGEVDDDDRRPSRASEAIEVPFVTADGNELPVLVRSETDTVDGTSLLVCVCRRSAGHRPAERQLRERKRELEALHGVAADLSACSTPEAVYDTVIRAVERILQFDFAIVDAAVDDVLVPVAISSTLDGDGYYEEIPLDATDSVAAEVYRTGETSVVDDAREHDAVPADAAFRSVLTVPIGQTALFQSASKSVGAFDEHDRRAVELLVAHADARLEQLDTEGRLRRRTEELERQNERLEEFASIVSHDLRNPLNVAQGRLGLARSDAAAAGAVGDEIDAHLEAVENAHDRMEELMEDILALAKQGEAVIDAESVSLRSVAEATWATVETGDATLAVDGDPTIQADRPRLQRLLANLFRNSVEHGSAGSSETPGGGDKHGTEQADIVVQAGDFENGFYVSDTGPGVPPDERASVFEAGYTNDPDGTGFGLAIVERIADAHGWHVTVTDGTAGGARFECHIE